MRRYACRGHAAERRAAHPNSFGGLDYQDSFETHQCAACSNIAEFAYDDEDHLCLLCHEPLAEDEKAACKKCRWEGMAAFEAPPT